MTREQAIYDYAVIVLLYKNEIIDIANRQGLSSLTYDTPISKVNELVINNLNNRKFIADIDKMLHDKAWETDEYRYEPITISATVAWIIAGVITAATTIAIVDKVNRAKKERDAIFRDNLRSRYLTKEQLDEIAFIERKRLGQEFLVAQSDFLQREENEIQAKREEDRKNILYIVVGGIFLVAGVSYYMNKNKN